MSIKEFLKEDGSYFSFQEFQRKIFMQHKTSSSIFRLLAPYLLRLKARKIESVQYSVLHKQSFSFQDKFHIQPRKTSTIFSMIEPAMEVRPVLKILTLGKDV